MVVDFSMIINTAFVITLEFVSSLESKPKQQKSIHNKYFNIHTAKDNLSLYYLRNGEKNESNVMWTQQQQQKKRICLFYV